MNNWLTRTWVANVGQSATVTGAVIMRMHGYVDVRGLVILSPAKLSSVISRTQILPASSELLYSTGTLAHGG